ncbi:hypothetical protein ETAA8_61220 [Anatilimnocola aggregata]|uniref:DUF4175 family protein n=1 Tax=Anatilimnocola aggregata TaxID=2528021 RepID=A0A517YL68_9BACT|nr:hypothetical protein [Anatilimnocola aggregata]QDU30969.1 hypothetical protein ETAA8_61220 [Anatilimnocola aggregata]
MSDIPLPQLSQMTAGVLTRLSKLRRQVTTWFWVDGLSRLAWAAIALLAADLALDWLFRMDKPQRAVMLAIIGAVLLYIVFRRLVKPLSATISDDALALEVERLNPHLHESVISALQFSRMEDLSERGYSPVMIRQTVQRGATASADLNFGNVLDDREFRVNSMLLLFALVLLGALVVGTFTNPLLNIWANRNLLLGDKEWPQKTYLLVERAENGKVVFPRGEDWTQLVTVTKESEVVPENVSIEFRRARGRATQTMKKTGERQFEAIFASVIEPFEFRAQGGDAYTPWVQVQLVEQPALDDLQLEVVPPAYTGLSPQPLAAGRGPYFVLKGSTLRLQGTANKELTKAELSYRLQKVEVIEPPPAKPAEKLAEGDSTEATAESSPAPTKPEPKKTRTYEVERHTPLSITEGMKLKGELPPDEVAGTQYTILLTDTLGLTSRRPTTFGLRIRADREPRVRARLIGISGMVVPKARIPFSCRVTDDFGLTDLRAKFRWDLLAQGGEDAGKSSGAGEIPFESLKDAFQGKPPGELALDEAIELGPHQIPTGSGLTFSFVAQDNDNVPDEVGAPVPNVGASSDFLVRVVTEEELRTDLLRREKEQRQEFERLVKSEEELLTDGQALEAATRDVAALTQEQKDQLMQMQKRQKVYGTNTGAIGERMANILIEVENNRLEEANGKLQGRLQEIIKPLRELADQDMPGLVQTLDQVRRQAAAQQPRNEAITTLLKQQEATIAKMKQVLALMVKSEGYQEAVNLLYEIQKSQQDVLDRTIKEQQERIKKLLEGAKPAESTPPGNK